MHDELETQEHAEHVSYPREMGDSVYQSMVPALNSTVENMYAVSFDLYQTTESRVKARLWYC